MKTKIIVVLGPTAVGKTAMGIALAQKFKGEIISGDSQQVYKELSIGTAKASAEEQAQAPHHLIDVRSVSETYSAYDFVQEAHQKIEEITGRGHVPILVGGTGLYLQSLLEGYHLGGQLDQATLLAYRKDLEALSDEALFAMAEQAQLEVSQINRRRAIRALELEKFGQDLVNQEPVYDALLIGLTDERDRVYDRINARVDSMMTAGLLDEVKWLYDNYPDSQASRGIGYKEFFPYFLGEETIEAAVDKLKQQTRRFAKRQLTWFRNRMEVTFYKVSDPSSQSRIEESVREFLDD